MQELDFEGLFWRPEEPSHKLAGRLRFNPTEGGVLSLIESQRISRTDNTKMPFTDLLGAPSENEDGIRILGVAGRHMITLDKCHQSGSSFQSHGPNLRRYQVNTILTGAHLGTSAPVRFTSLCVHLSNLASWVGRSGLSVDSLPEEAGNRTGIRLSYRSVPSIETDTDDGSIAITFPWRWQLNLLDKSTIEHRCALKYRFHALQPLSKVMEVCSSLRNLVTICAHAPSAILDTKVTHPDVDRPIGLYTRWIGAAVNKEQKEDALIRRANMALSFDDIGGLESLRSWLMLERRYSVVIALLVSHWYVPPLYQEQRYFNAVVAAETLVRIRMKKQDVNLKKELRHLAAEVSGIFVPLVGDLDGWAREVVRTRNDFVVHPGLQGSSDGYRLYLLSESIYLIVVLTLLRECGVSIDSLANTRDHAHFRWLADELAASS